MMIIFTITRQTRWYGGYVTLLDRL